jgi:hypothetical protein
MTTSRRNLQKRDRANKTAIRKQIKTAVVSALGQIFAVCRRCSLLQSDHLIGRNSLVMFMQTIRPVNVNIHHFAVSKSKVKTRII